MKRYVELSEISDGKLYEEEDMARLGCQDCAGCSACCRGMGDTIILDPLDVHRISGRLQKTPQELMGEGALALGVVDGIILPHLQMQPGSDACFFLNSEGRCSIHESRPGICRLFPLGRYYENGDFRYFLQTDECRRERRSKVRISKWIDTPDLPRYRQFVLDWHYFLNDVEERLKAQPEMARQWDTLILQGFYLTAYEAEEEFYPQFQKRLQTYSRIIGVSDTRIE